MIQQNIETMNLNNQTKERIKGTLGVFLLMFIILAAIGLTLGSIFMGALVFWFMIVPSVALNLPPKISKNEDHRFESLAGMGLFYAFMVLMIYKHYQSDYFTLMMVSAVCNLLLIYYLTKDGNQNQSDREELSRG